MGDQPTTQPPPEKLSVLKQKISQVTDPTAKALLEDFEAEILALVGPPC